MVTATAVLSFGSQLLIHASLQFCGIESCQLQCVGIVVQATCETFPSSNSAAVSCRYTSFPSVYMKNMMQSILNIVAIAQTDP